MVLLLYEGTLVETTGLVPLGLDHSGSVFNLRQSGMLLWSPILCSSLELIWGEVVLHILEISAT